MAAGLGGSQPGTMVRINQLGRRKISDMIWLVAKSCWSSHRMDYESKE
jgi:hypothetical protein